MPCQVATYQGTLIVGRGLEEAGLEPRTAALQSGALPSIGPRRLLNTVQPTWIEPPICS